MYRITFVLGDLKEGLGRSGPSSLVVRPPVSAHLPLPTGLGAADQFGTLLGALVDSDVLYLRAHPELPPMSDTGVQFADEPQGYLKTGEENWQDIPSCLALRKAGNRDLVCWRCAELRLRHGIAALPVVTSERTWSGMLRYRAVVKLPDGTIEDPSLGRGARDVPKNHRVAIVLGLFNGPQERQLSNETLQVLLDALREVDERYLLARPETPLLYRTGIVYQEEPPGQEDWQDVATTIRMRFGDCLPTSTLVLRDDYSFAPIGSLVPGDRIMGDGGFTTVLDSGFTGEKPILSFELNNGCVLRASPEHRLFLDDGTEVRAEDVKVGDWLKAPSEPFPTLGGFRPDDRISDVDMAWLVGTYVADGWHARDRNNFSISGFDDRPKRRKIEQKERVVDICNRAGINQRWAKKYVTVYDKALFDVMASCGALAPIKKLPTMAWTEQQIRDGLIPGLETDASTANSGTITHGTTSPELAMQIRVLYRMLGQSVHIRSWSQEEHRGLGTHPMYRIGVRRHTEALSNIRHVRSRAEHHRVAARVRSIREEEPEECCDITTESGRFYLPESDLVVHNCEDLACWRAAELRVRFGIDARPTFTSQVGGDGRHLYHILVRLPDGRIEDPSRNLGMR